MEFEINNISRIGLGCVTFGREIERDAAFTFMDYAWEKGINFFDTAAAYGNGASEEIVGAWLASRKPSPGSLIVATKILPPFEPDAIGQAVHTNLKRLGVETLDLLYFHCWNEALQRAEVLTAVNKLVQQGTIKRLGASNFTAEQLQPVLQMQQANGFTPITFIQNNHNLAVSDLTTSLRQLCETNHINIVTYSPLGAGFLTGKHMQGVAAGSRFDIIPGHQQVYFTEEAQRRLRQLQELSARTGYSMVQLALTWALHQPGIASVLIGGRGPQHLAQALQYLDVEAQSIIVELQRTFV